MIDSSEKAEVKLILAEETSNLENDEPEGQIQKSRLKRRRIFDCSSEKEEEQLSMKNLQKSPTKLCIADSEQAVLVQNYTSVTPNPNLLFLSPCCKKKSTVAHVSSAENFIILALEEVRQDLKELKDTVNHLLFLNKENEKGKEEVCLYKSMLPIKDMEMLSRWETELERTDFFEKMMALLAQVGGQTVDQTTRRILADTLSNECAANLNWAGRGSKQSFRSLNTYKLVLEAVKMNFSEKFVTEKEIQDVIKSFLRFAPVRLKYQASKSSNTDL